MSQTRILVVDNSPMSAGMIAEYLTKAGHAVTVKSSLAEALNWLQMPGNSPDVIISEVMMSKQNGHEFIRQVRTDPAAIHPLVILLAAQEDIAEKIAGFEAGADDYLVKPVNTIELGLRVRALLTRAHAYPPVLAAPG